MKWLSVHIYYSGHIYSYESDRVILEFVKPYIERCTAYGWISKYFFIRYSELGSHLRLRFFGDPEILENILKPDFEVFHKKHFPKDLIEYPFKESSISSGDIEKESKPYLWKQYKPETERYGGQEAIEVTEEFFHLSSKTAIDQVDKMGHGDLSLRLGKGLIATLIIAKACFEDTAEAASFVEAYSLGYLNARTQSSEEVKDWNEAFCHGFDKQSQMLMEYITAIWEVLDENGKIDESFDIFFAELKLIVARLKQIMVEGKILKNDAAITEWKIAARMIVSSYVHMMNNRLGISIPEESYLTYLINKALVAEERMNSL